LINNNLLKANKVLENCKRKDLVVLYAAIFSGSDEIMVVEEVNFIIKVATEIKRNIPNFKLIFRTYPSLADSSLYDPLRVIDWIDIYEHKNYTIVPRLGNSSETISFNDKADEKIEQFHYVDVLLSAGSTYTIEFAFSNTPIIHINAETFRKNFESSKFLDRLAIYGHLEHLSPSGFDNNVVGSTKCLINSLCQLDLLSVSGYSEYLRAFAKPKPGTFSRDLIAEFLTNCFQK